MTSPQTDCNDLDTLRLALDQGLGEDTCEALHTLCPCRNRILDLELWRGVFRLMESDDERVRHSAAHAVATLRQRAETDEAWRGLLAQLQPEHEQLIANPACRSMLWAEDRICRDERLLPGAQRKLIRTLETGTPEEKRQALRLLCPCRNRIYDRNLWKEILKARECSDPGVRDGANHALGTLQQRAQKDPRSWELIHDLEREGGFAGLTTSIAMWGPRSRPSRRKRMTQCRAGKQKAAAWLYMENDRGLFQDG